MPRQAFVILSLTQLFFNLPLFALVGWSEPVLLDGGVLAYAAAVDPATELLYFVTEKTVANKRQLYLQLPGQTKPRLLAETTANLRMNPTIAVRNGLVLVAWQQLLPKANVAIRWLFSNDGGENFLPYGEATGRLPNRPLLLPKAAIDETGNLFLFAQEEETAGRITLVVASGREGKFSAFVPLVTERAELGRGVFFPSIVAYEGNAYVLYQGRQEQSLTDELFSLRVNATTLKLKGPDRLTKNNYHDYAPFLALGTRGLEWVWQSNEAKNWQIFHAGSEEPRRSITSSNTNAYQPSLLILSSNLRIISWLDFRQTPPQVFAIFPDRGKEFATGNEHNVSQSKLAAEAPLLVGAGSTGYVLYLTKGQLYARKVDNRTEKIILSSRTHPLNKAVANTRAEFRWQVNNEISGIDAVGYIVNQQPTSEVPLYNANPQNNIILVENLVGGRYFLHFRYRDKAGNESSVVSYPFIIDNQIPATPRISSTTHQENSVSKNRNVDFTFEANDDSGIKGFYYSFSNQPQGRLRQYTTQNSLTFGPLADGVYFFQVQAEDLAGNLSDIAIFRFEIAQQERSNLVVNANLVNGYPVGNELVFWVKDMANRPISLAQYIRGSTPNDSRGIRGELAAVPQENSYCFSLPWKASKAEQEIFSLRFRFADGSWSEDYHLVIGSTYPLKPIMKKTSPVVKPYGVMPSVVTQQVAEGLSLKFTVPEEYRPKLKGYFWTLNEELPQNTNLVNSVKGNEILASLPAGKHLLRLRPVFSDPNLYGEILETTIELSPLPLAKPTFSLKWYFTIVVVLFLGLFVVSLLIGIKRIRYFISIFRSV